MADELVINIEKEEYSLLISQWCQPPKKWFPAIYLAILGILSLQALNQLISYRGHVYLCWDLSSTGIKVGYVHFLCEVEAAAYILVELTTTMTYITLCTGKHWCAWNYCRYNGVQSHSNISLLFSTCWTEHVTHILWLLYYHVNRILRLLLLVEVMQSHLPVIAVSFWDGLVSIFCYWHLMLDCSGTVGTEYGIIGCRICRSISCSCSYKSSSQFLGCYLHTDVSI